ncbi:MAG: hypothetical protein AAFU64_11915, partial [Bacteroidota bacterium]
LIPDKSFIWNQEVPYISGSQLRQYAATIYSEASFMGLVQQIAPGDPIREMQRETFAIAYTMYNYAMAKGAAFRRAGRQYGLRELLVDNNYTKGISSPAHQEYLMGQGGDDMRRKFATLAVIKLFTRQVQDVQDVIQNLQGAQYWDGNDLFRLFKSHFRAKYGFELSNPQHGMIYQNVSVVRNTQTITSSPASNPKVSTKRQYTYMSTMTAGGTIFFKIHPQAAAQGITW